MPDESYEEKMKISREIRERLIQADEAIKNNKVREAANHYKTAAELSKTLGHNELSIDYFNKAHELMKSIGETFPTEAPPPIKLPASVGKPVGVMPISDHLEDVMKRADRAITEGKFNEAAKVYEEAARSIPAEAERLLSEAIELRKKEKNLIVTRKEIQRKTSHKQEYEENLEKIKEALENGKYQELVTLYGRAAVLAERLGKRSEAGEYRKAAIEAKRKVIKTRKVDPKAGRIELVKQYTELLKQIKLFLDEKMWQEAADGYLKAAQFSYELEEFDRAKQFKEKAAKIQEQADILEHETQLKKRERALKEEIEALDPEKDTDTLIQSCSELSKIYQELENSKGLEEISKKFDKIKKIQERKKSLKNANKAIEEEDYSKALELFQNALRISMDLNEPIKAEGFRNIINELSGKVDKVARSRKMVEDRAEILTSAKAAIAESPPNVAKAIQDYKEAARISFELGENELANSYLQTAKHIEEDQGLLVERENFIKEAKAAIKEKNFELASKFYEQAAKFSERIGDGSEEKYRKKAKALRDLAEEL